MRKIAEINLNNDRQFQRSIERAEIVRNLNDECEHVMFFRVNAFVIHNISLSPSINPPHDDAVYT